MSYRSQEQVQLHELHSCSLLCSLSSALHCIQNLYIKKNLLVFVQDARKVEHEETLITFHFILIYLNFRPQKSYAKIIRVDCQEVITETKT